MPVTVKIWPLMLLLGALVALFGCLSVPTGKVRKVGKDTYTEVRKEVPGLPFLGYSRWEKKQSPMEETKKILQAPAKWTLYVAVPVSLIAFALTLVSQAPPIQKKAGSVAILGGLVCAGATAYLLATTYMWLLIVALVAAGAALMYNYKDRGILFRCQKKN